MISVTRAQGARRHRPQRSLRLCRGQGCARCQVPRQPRGRTQSKVSSAAAADSNASTDSKTNAAAHTAEEARCSPSLSHGRVLSADRCLFASHAVGGRAACACRVAIRFRRHLEGCVAGLDPRRKGQVRNSVLVAGEHLARIWRCCHMAIFVAAQRRSKPGRPYGAVCIGHCRRARCTCVASRLGQRTREGGRLRTSAFGDTLPRSPETPRRLSAEGTLWYSQNDCAQHPPSAFHGGMACTLLPNGMDHVL